MGTFVVSDTREPQARPLSDVESANRQTVIDYYRAMVETLDFDNVRPYVNEDFLDHNPALPEGGLAELEAFTNIGLRTHFPDAVIDVRHIVVDGAYVLFRIAGRLRPQDTEDMVMELFRLRDNKISEHWEVVGPAGTRVIESVFQKG